MQCPKCDGNTQVLESRWLKTTNQRRRHRICYVCDARFTSYETIRTAAANKQLNLIKQKQPEISQLLGLV